MAVDWTLLPLDLLAAIAMNLDTFEDFIYFSVVCRCWNRASSLIKLEWRAIPVPWLLLAENTKENPNCLRKIYNLNNKKCYQLNLPETFGARCWGTPYGWVAMVKRDLSIQLFNPMTKVQIPFPSLETIPNLPVYFDEGGEEDYYHWCLAFLVTKLFVLRVCQSGHHEFVIMVLYNVNDTSEETKGLAFARHGDLSWTSVFVEETSVNIVDVVNIDDIVFALYDDGAVQFWNVKEFYRRELVKPMHYLPSELGLFEEMKQLLHKIYLLRSGSDLLMVFRYKDHAELSDDEIIKNYQGCIQVTFGFRVFRLEPKDKRWREIEDLGEVVLFVGSNTSMSVSTAHAKCLQRNCIYFTDDDNVLWSMSIYGNHDIGVYDMKSEEILTLYEGDCMRSTFCSPTFFVPQF